MGIPRTPDWSNGSVAGDCFIHPPQPEMYTFSIWSTRNATGDILGFGLPLPKTVEYWKVLRSADNLAMN